ncbi:MAG: hypothetical protein KGZ30_04475 [Anaplasmataceae bacterium]|nr:hypothetical protein [Anaplasmataceae bacterium]
MKVFLGATFLTVMVVGFFLLFRGGEGVVVVSPGLIEEEIVSRPTGTIASQSEVVDDPRRDISPQKPLLNPPANIKAIYLTGWSAGLSSRVENVKRLAKEGLINAVVIDVKDYSGYLSYETDIKLAEQVGAHDELRIVRPNALIKELHDAGLYVIGRISVFQDPKLASGRPDLALKNQDNTLWRDNKGLAWLDPAAQPVWDYVIDIGEDAVNRGFDELNYDYIRFPSDGNLEAIVYPYWNESSSREVVIKNFFSYLRYSLSDHRISADLFGLVTVRHDDLGIGQVLENALPYFDAVAPMVYPSHYGAGFLGFKNPAEYPYEVIDNALQISLHRMLKLSASSSNEKQATIRPWLQDFDLGADYDEAKVRAQIAAVEKWQKRYPEAVDGWMIWSPSNVYTEKALYPKTTTVTNDSTSTVIER